MRGRWRYPAMAFAALLVLAAAGVVGFRVFAPAETLTVSAEGYPAAKPAILGISGELPRTPLIVDGRLRVYAARRQVWADAPVGARTETTPYWSLRRWPYEVLGVVDVPGPLVVSQWSDGALLAINAKTGAIAWRGRSAAGGPGYAGGSTGAATVYEPRALYTGRTGDGRVVVVSTVARVAGGFDATDGSPLWTARLACEGEGFTGPGFYAQVDSCAGDATLRRYDLATGVALPDWRTTNGTIAPLGCGLGRSQCTAIRTGTGDAGEGWLLGPQLVRVSSLDQPGTWYSGGLAVVGLAAANGSDGRGLVAQVAAFEAPGNTPRWTWRPPPGSADQSPARIVAAHPERIYLITQRRTLVVLDADSGLELTRTPLERLNVPVDPWVPGYFYARDGFVVVERLREAPAGSRLGLRPVVIAGS